jgi:hypothetical protein
MFAFGRALALAALLLAVAWTAARLTLDIQLKPRAINGGADAR